MKVWYTNWYESLERNGHLMKWQDWLDKNVHTAEDRALIAWQIVRWHTDRAFKRMDVAGTGISQPYGSQPIPLRRVPHAHETQ